AHDGIARKCAGDFTELVAAHAVGDQPEPELAIAIAGVFIVFAAEADVAQEAVFDHSWGFVDGAADGSRATGFGLPQTGILLRNRVHRHPPWMRCHGMMPRGPKAWQPHDAVRQERPAVGEVTRNYTEEGGRTGHAGFPFRVLGHTVARQAGRSV